MASLLTTKHRWHKNPVIAQAQRKVHCRCLEKKHFCEQLKKPVPQSTCQRPEAQRNEIPPGGQALSILETLSDFLPGRESIHSVQCVS